MIYCHECGSEITEKDTFCPFCGISIQPVNIGDSESEIEDDLTTSDVKDSEDSSIEIDSADTNVDSSTSFDEDIDMSETIVVRQDSTEETKDQAAENKVDSGYLDISTLKSDEELSEEAKITDSAVESEDDGFLTADQLGNDQVDNSDVSANDTENDETQKQIEESVNSEDVVDSSSYLDVSENQDDIEDLLDEDPSKVEESVESDSNGLSVSDEAQATADKKAIDVVVETVETENQNEEPEGKQLESSTDQTENKIIVEDKTVSEMFEDKVSTDEFSEMETKPAEQSLSLEEKVSAEIAEKVKAATAETKPADDLIETTNEVDEKNNDSTDIQSVEESEIDDAISVIDSKALVWKQNEDELRNEQVVDRSDENVANVESDSIEPEMRADEGQSVSMDAEIAVSKELSEAKNDHENQENFGDKSEESSVPLENPATSDKTEIVESDDNLYEQQTSANEADDLDIATESAPADESFEVKAPAKKNESEQIGQSIVSETHEEPATAEESSIENTEVQIEQDEKPTPTTPNMGVVDTDGNKSTKLKPIEEGVVLNNRYEIVRKIGGGGMGAVYLANDKNLGGVLRAVKEMVQSYIEEEQQEKALNDFKRESMLLTSLEHPSIPTIYDYFYDQKEGRFYLVMKYISGGDLAARLRAAPEGRIDEISVTDWAYQIADVLEYLHTRNPCIVYRDLKPANIMIDGNSNKVMLIDFGIARSINKEEKGVTAVGTMGYAPPELFSGNVQPASDIYSLGSTMFHLLTGADPQSNPLLIFDFQKHPRPRQINPQLSDQMERILMRAVEYNAEKRFSSAAEMRNALKEHLDNLKAGRISFGIKETPTAVALSDQPVFCGFCGQKIVATDMFCAFCGAKQPLAQPGVHSQEYHIPQTTAKLVIEGTSDLDYPAFELVKNENLLGRRDPMSNIFPEIDLSKFDPQTKISRKHARIWREGDKLLLEDLGSSNGTTWISAQGKQSRLMPNQTQVLQNGDKIQVGDTTLQFISG